MRKLILILVLLFSFNGWAENTTIVCLLDGESDEISNVYTSNSRKIKLQQTIVFNSNGLSMFTNQFLTDYDFLEAAMLDRGLEQGKLELSSSVTENTIVFSIRNKEKYYAAGNHEVNRIIFDLNINRKTGVAKADASFSYTIDNRGTEITPLMESLRISYSAFGNCDKGKNKF